MARPIRQSLLARLLGAYLLFVVVVLGTGLVVNDRIQRQLQADVHAADLALAQAIAHDVDAKLHSTRQALGALSTLEEVRAGDVNGMTRTFRAFKAARRDVDRVYWFDANGIMRASVPANVRTQDGDFSQRRLFQQATTSAGPVAASGLVDLTTYQAVAALALPVRDDRGDLRGVVAANLLLDDFSTSLQAIVNTQAKQNKPMLISLVDHQGMLIASPERERLLQPMFDELPGLDEALQGQAATRLESGPRGQKWLYSAVPVPDSGWAVVVQRPTASALATVNDFNTWLLVIAGLFAVGGLLFWVELLGWVIRPLQRLATAYQSLRPAGSIVPAHTSSLAARTDEVGGLATALQRLERDVTTQLLELRTLLDTSKVVVETLDPGKVATAIIHEVQRLVDVQAAAVLVPNPGGGLRVLASEGRGPEYSETIRQRPLTASSPATQALHEQRPVQLVASDPLFPPISYEEGFRALLAIPIRSPHAGDVVLTVHRSQPQPFDDNEIDLLMTFGNYAALAWEHAVLYQRSDVRLREEQQTLAAIVRSMSDGLVLAGVDGTVLYTNPGADELVGREPRTIDEVHAALRASAVRPDLYDHEQHQAERGSIPVWTIETGRNDQHHAIQLRLFDVRGEQGEVIGRGLLLRDVTREQEIDQFKTTLLGAVGHELRTPLAIIKMHASTLLQQDVDWSPAEQHEFVTDISDEADRLASLVSTLLDMSRLEAGLLHMALVPCTLDVLIGRTVSRLREPIADLHLDLPPDLPLVLADEARLEVVLRNLLANAQAYGNGTVRVGARQQGELVVVSVADDGPGIAPDELPHLFERFYRAARGQQLRSSGVGLGLAICKAFVQAHGGHIWAESTRGGATFSFTLLAAPALANPEHNDVILASHA